MTLIIFDIDGTLVYTTDHLDSKCFAATYERVYGQPFPTINWHLYPHVTDDSIIKKVIKDHFNRPLQEKEVEFFQQHYVQNLKAGRLDNPNQYREVPGAGQVLKMLIKHPDYMIGIATGGWEEPARIKLHHVGIPVDELMISGADGRETRETIIDDLISKVEKKGVNFSRKVYIGDALWDVQTTRNMQMNFIGIRWKNDWHTLLEAGASQVLTDFTDFRRFLDAVDQAVPPI